MKNISRLLLIAAAIVGCFLVAIFLLLSYFNHQKHLQQAKSIINYIGAQSDLNGMYGWGQDCTKDPAGTYECQARRLQYRAALGDDAFYASNQYQISQIWARYQYYQATADPEQLSLLEQDISNYRTYILDHPETWLAQTSRFHCLLLQDIVNDDALPAATRDTALEICLGTFYERHPNSLVSSDQHDHTPFVFQDQNHYEWPVSLAPGLYPDQTITYEREQVISDIIAFIREVNAAPDSLSFPTELAATAPHFLRREIIAAIDHVAALALYQNASAEIRAQYFIDELDYLLFTLETLRWLFHNPSGTLYADTCLVKENLEYFLKQYPHDLTNSEKNTFLSRLSYQWGDPYMNYCRLAGTYLHQKKYRQTTIYREMVQFNQLQQTSDWSLGYLYPWSYDNLTQSQSLNGEYRYEYDINAILAGLLAK